MRAPNLMMTGTLAITLAAVPACTKNTEKTSLTVAELQASADAIGSLFGSFAGGNSKTSRLGAPAVAASALDPTQETCNNLGAGPGHVIMSGRGQSGGFGTRSNGVTLDVDADFCIDSTGTTQTSAASDGLPRYATFILAGTMSSDCGTTSISMTSGSGATRNEDGGVAKIYGSFIINGFAVNCSLIIDFVSGLDTASSTCHDSNGQTVSVGNGNSCVLAGDVERMAIPSPIKGHYALENDSSSTSVAYDCANPRSFSEDANHIRSFVQDCTTFNSYHFNLEGIDIGYIVSGDVASGWHIYANYQEDQLLGRIKLMRIAGIPVFASMDILYVPGYVPGGASSDGEDFPESLVSNADFQLDLTTEIVALASKLETAKVEIFAPIAEPDRVMLTPARASSFMASILTPLRAAFGGKLVYEAAYFDSSMLGGGSLSDYSFAGYDYGGINISPYPSNGDLASFSTSLADRMTNLKATADAAGIPFLIWNAGIWGEAIGNSFDWGNATNARAAFELMYTQSQTIGADGIMFWEGTTGEVTFGAYSGVASYIQGVFN